MVSPMYLFTSVALLNCVVHCCHKFVFSPPPPLGITFYICDQKEPQCLNWDAVTTAISIIVSFLLFYDDIDIQPLLGHPNPMGSFFAIFDLLRKEDAFFFLSFVEMLCTHRAIQLSVGVMNHSAGALQWYTREKRRRNEKLTKFMRWKDEIILAP